MEANQALQILTRQRDCILKKRTYVSNATYIIWSLFGLIETYTILFLFGVLETFIAFRIGLKLIAANANNPVALFVYTVSDLFVSLFTGLTITPSVGDGMLETSSVIAMLVYALLGWVFERTIRIIFYCPPATTLMSPSM